MKIKKIEQINDFLAAIDQCKKDVWLISRFGDKYNLKSVLTRYIALGALLQDLNEELELFCDSKEDEAIMLKFFRDHPEI